jgi:hypothetical protein
MRFKAVDLMDDPRTFEAHLRTPVSELVIGTDT